MRGYMARQEYVKKAPWLDNTKGVRIPRDGVYHVVFTEYHDDGFYYTIEVPGLPGLVSRGSGLVEGFRMAREAIWCYTGRRPFDLTYEVRVGRD